MAEFNVDVTRLPDEIREKLAELELELSEGKYLLTVFSFLSLPFAGSLSEGSTAGVSSPPLQAFANPSADKSDSFQLPARFSMLRFFYFLYNVCPF